MLDRIRNLSSKYRLFFGTQASFCYPQRTFVSDSDKFTRQCLCRIGRIKIDLLKSRLHLDGIAVRLQKTAQWTICPQTSLTVQHSSRLLWNANTVASAPSLSLSLSLSHSLSSDNVFVMVSQTKITRSSADADKPARRVWRSVKVTLC